MKGDRCPPHKFIPAWSSVDESMGVIFCQWCAEIMPLQPRTMEAPDAEKLTPEEMQQISRDYGEPT